MKYIILTILYLILVTSIPATPDIENVTNSISLFRYLEGRWHDGYASSGNVKSEIEFHVMSDEQSIVCARNMHGRRVALRDYSIIIWHPGSGKYLHKYILGHNASHKRPWKLYEYTGEFDINKKCLNWYRTNDMPGFRWELKSNNEMWFRGLDPNDPTKANENFHMKVTRISSETNQVEAVTEKEKSISSPITSFQQIAHPKQQQISTSKKTRKGVPGKAPIKTGKE